MTALSALLAASNSVAETSKRKAKTERLAAFLCALDPREVEVGVAYLSGEIPQGSVGIGPASLRRASEGVAPAAEPSLQLLDIDEALSQIAQATGKGSLETRTQLLAGLFGKATPAEQQLLFRLLVGELRHGALEGVMLEAVALASRVEPAELRRAHASGASLATVAVAALKEGTPGLARFALKLLAPVRPMLAQTAADVAGAFAELGPMAVEWKLDGARVQVHRHGDEVRVFSRALNDVTAAVPELVELARRFPVDSLLLDGEAIALRPNGKPYPFQDTMRRFGRRLDVETLRAELPLSAFFFDCLHLDGHDLTGLSNRERWETLARIVPPESRVQRRVVDAPEPAEQFFEEALANGHEGVMAKALDAPYAAGSRGAGWLKIKRAHTLDLVVLAAEWGHGRRKGWLSNLHLGARDPASGGFVMLGKTFKGMTDVLLARQTEQLLLREVRRDDWTVYVRPELVVEIAFDGVQASTQYPGGVALRFARVKGYRPDKGAAEADTLEQVRAWLA